MKNRGETICELQARARGGISVETEAMKFDVILTVHRR